MKKQRFSCIKCEGAHYKAGKIRTTGSGFTRFMNIQNQAFTTVSCTKCGYTELYRTDGGGAAGNILDFLSN